MLTNWRRPEFLLILMSCAVPLSFATWQALLNNFAIERAAFSGQEMGILQSLREIPGFLAFAIVYLLLIIKEQRLALLSLILLGLGTAVIGLFPSIVGLYITTVVMSLGFHYFESVQSSLALQWLDKATTAEWLGKILAAGSFASILTFGLVWLGFDLLQLDYAGMYLLGGSLTVIITIMCWLLYPQYESKVVQHKHMVLRKRYWLYYLLVFMSGARRQIFVVFAGFLMVEKFGFDVQAITLLFLFNALLNVFLAPRIGRLIGKWGERRALIFEYSGLILIFTAYAFVNNSTIAAGLYILDHMFFALAIAINTYFQKIADPKDIASTAGISFTINHIAAVVLPAFLGLLWLLSPTAVFLCGSAIALTSLVLSFNVPSKPEPGNETAWKPLIASLAASKT